MIIHNHIFPTLELIGYYAFAGGLAANLSRLVGPVYYALFPRFSQLATLNDQEELKQLYHRSCQLMSVLILPVTVVIALFAPEILLLWTQNSITAEQTHLLLSLLIIGTALNGLMHLPYAVQLAHGWTKLAFSTNIVAVILLVPLTILMISNYGAVGAACIWVILNGGYVVIGLQLMHRRLLKGEISRWYLEDVGLPLIAALLTAGVARYLMVGPMPSLATFIYLAVVSLATLAASAIAAPQIRAWVFSQVWRVYTSYEARLSR